MKMERSSIKRNIGYQMIYEMLGLILPLATSPYIARVIGAEGLGQYSYSYSVAYYFVLFSMLGIRVYGNRSIAQVRDVPEKRNKVFSNLLAIHVLISLICFVLYIGYVLTLKEDRLFAVIQCAYVLSGLFDISWFYFGMEKFKLTATRSSVIKILNAVCLFEFVKNADDLWKYCAIMAGGTLLGQMVMWLPLRKYVHFVCPNVHDMLPLVKPLFIFFIPSIAVSLYKYMDKIMIGILSDKIQLGLYENSEKIINVPNTVIGAFSSVMLPKISYLVAQNDNRLSTRYMLVSMRYVMCLSFAFTFGIAGVGRVFAPIFWGEAFSDAGMLIMCLVMTVPFISFAAVIRTQYLIPHSREWGFIIAVLTGAVINLIVNAILIPLWGALGAVIATIAAEVLVCAIHVLAGKNELPLGVYFKNSLPFFAFGIFMFIFVYEIGQLLGSSVITLMIQILSGGLIYVLLCAAYLWFIKDGIFMDALKFFTSKILSLLGQS